MLLINWLKKPYFFINSPKYNLLLCFGVGLFVFLFLFIFQPFGIPNILNNKLIYTGGFGLVTFLIQSFYFIVLPAIFTNFFKDENWTVGKNIFFLLLLIIGISFGNYFYNSFSQNSDTRALLSVQEFFIYTFSVAIFPILFFTYLSEKLYTLYRKKASEKIMKLKVISEPKKIEKEIKIFGDNNKECIVFNSSKLVYLSSNGNYASFFLVDKRNTLKESVIRTTLTKLILDLKEHKNFIRCHKSYIVNTNYIDSISGNARGYYLTSSVIPQQIPVSRKFSKEDLKSLIN